MKAFAKQSLGLLTLLALLPWIGSAQVVPPLNPSGGVSVNFKDTPLDQVLDFYRDLTGRTMIRAPGVNASISIQSEGRLPPQDALIAIESALAMHGIVMVPMGEKFLRVVQTAAVRQEGLPILVDDPEQPIPDNDQILSLILNLQHLEFSEVQPIIQQMVHGYGKVQQLERTNSIMVTDTGSNLNRILEILAFIDRPVEMREDIFVRQILYAEAAQIAARLNEFISDQQQPERPRVATAPGGPPETPRGPPGVIRAPRPDAAPTPMEAAAELAERGIIQGRVKIVSDERINTLFIISRPANFTFFDRIIDILDQPVDPETIVRVISLEYALAEDISGILNEFIGAASSDAPSRAFGATGETTASTRAEALRDFAAGLARERPVGSAPQSEDASRIGRLSSTTRILSDQRSNALLLMGRRGDIAVLEEIIDQLDIMLGQVLIEAVIVEINLGKTQETGIDWLQRTLNAYSDTRAGPGGGVVISEPVLAFGGGSRQTGASLGSVRDQLLGDNFGADIGSGGLSYYLTFFNLNVDAVIRLAASSRDARILSTPVILTTDNTEAKIIVGESRPIVTSTSSSTVGDRTVSSYQYRDIGINLTVTPRINPRRVVIMEISQSADNVGGDVEIDGNRVPIITRREMQASIAVQSRSTIVLGGLVSTDQSSAATKVPILGDIPILGRLFRSDAKADSRTELLVLITPYVLMTPDEARNESARLHNSSHSSRTRWHEGWSDSEFARSAREEEPEPTRRFARDKRAPLDVPAHEVPQRPVPERPVPERVLEMDSGEYSREDMINLLRELQGTEPDVEPRIQDDPLGVIRWKETDQEEFIPLVEVENAAPMDAPAPAAESPAPEPVAEPPRRQPVYDVNMPMPLR